MDVFCSKDKIRRKTSEPESPILIKLQAWSTEEPCSKTQSSPNGNELIRSGVIYWKHRRITTNKYFEEENQTIEQYNTTLAGILHQFPEAAAQRCS